MPLHYKFIDYTLLLHLHIIIVRAFYSGINKKCFGTDDKNCRCDQRTSQFDHTVWVVFIQPRQEPPKITNNIFFCYTVFTRLSTEAYYGFQNSFSSEFWSTRWLTMSPYSFMPTVNVCSPRSAWRLWTWMNFTFSSQIALLQRQCAYVLLWQMFYVQSAMFRAVLTDIVFWTE